MGELYEQQEGKKELYSTVPFESRLKRSSSAFSLIKRSIVMVLAFEVFLDAVQSSAQISGIKISNGLFIKLLAYTKDLDVFISAYIEWWSVSRVWPLLQIFTHGRSSVDKYMYTEERSWWPTTDK
jgi:hypothetical protein